MLSNWVRSQAAGDFAPTLARIPPLFDFLHPRAVVLLLFAAAAVPAGLASSARTRPVTFAEIFHSWEQRESKR